MNFHEARAQFPVLDEVAYLNAGSMGPLARATVEAMAAQQLADLELGRGGLPYIDTMLELRKRVRAGLAATIRVPPENLALTTSTTDGCNIVLSGLRLRSEDEIVTTDTEHFGLLGALDASEATVRVAAVRAQPSERALETILAQVTPRTRLIALSHVSWQTGNLLPVEEIQDATGLPMLVDGAQTAGAIAVEAARYDFYTVSGQKWLCGPDATGALYVREPEALQVALPTYFSQDGHDESGTFTPKPGAARFDSGWIPTPALAGTGGGPWHDSPLGGPPWDRDLRALLDVARQPLRGRDRARPGESRLVRARGRPRRDRPQVVRSRHRRPGHAGHRLAAGLLRLVDERRATSSDCSPRCRELAQATGPSRRWIGP